MCARYSQRQEKGITSPTTGAQNYITMVVNHCVGAGNPIWVL